MDFQENVDARNKEMTLLHQQKDKLEVELAKFKEEHLAF
jgi:hypothetical protein